MMKKRMKQIAACAVAATMVAALAGCGSGGNDSGSGSGGESGDKITLHFSFDQGVGEPTQQIVDKFNESQDKIQVETVILPQDANQIHDDFVNKLASEDTSVDIMGLKFPGRRQNSHRERHHRRIEAVRCLLCARHGGKSHLSHL